VFSYRSLEYLLGFDKVLPVTEKWSAAADFLKIISDYCMENKPQNIVECSSGTSSLVLSQCCRTNQHGHVYSLENGKEFVNQTREQLADFSLTEFCDVLHASLKTVSISDEAFQWYDYSDLPDIQIDLLVVDGPPGFIQKHSRYPALPLLFDRLARHCTIFMDDAGRDDEQEIIKRWLKVYPGFQFDYISNERGCAILRR